MILENEEISRRCIVIQVSTDILIKQIDLRGLRAILLQ